MQVGNQVVVLLAQLRPRHRVHGRDLVTRDPAHDVDVVGREPVGEIGLAEHAAHAVAVRVASCVEVAQLADFACRDRALHGVEASARAQHVADLEHLHIAGEHALELQRLVEPRGERLLEEDARAVAYGVAERLGAHPLRRRDDDGVDLRMAAKRLLVAAARIARDAEPGGERFRLLGGVADRGDELAIRALRQDRAVNSRHPAGAKEGNVERGVHAALRLKESRVSMASSNSIARSVLSSAMAHLPAANSST
jgi:hypothetical protein